MHPYHGGARACGGYAYDRKALQDRCHDSSDRSHSTWRRPASPHPDSNATLPQLPPARLGAALTTVAASTSGLRCLTAATGTAEGQLPRVGSSRPRRPGPPPAGQLELSRAPPSPGTASGWDGKAWFLLLRNERCQKDCILPSGGTFSLLSSSPLLPRRPSQKSPPPLLPIQAHSNDHHTTPPRLPPSRHFKAAGAGAGGPKSTWPTRGGQPRRRNPQRTDHTTSTLATHRRIRPKAAPEASGIAAGSPFTQVPLVVAGEVGADAPAGREGRGRREPQPTIVAHPGSALPAQAGGRNTWLPRPCTSGFCHPHLL